MSQCVCIVLNWFRSYRAIDAFIAFSHGMCTLYSCLVSHFGCNIFVISSKSAARNCLPKRQTFDSISYSFVWWNGEPVICCVAKIYKNLTYTLLHCIILHSSHLTYEMNILSLNFVLFSKRIISWKILSSCPIAAALVEIT